MVLETQHDDYLTTELEKQKRKLKDIRNIIDQQHQLLRLIVQVRVELIFLDIQFTLELKIFRKWKSRPKQMMSTRE